MALAAVSSSSATITTIIKSNLKNFKAINGRIKPTAAAATTAADADESNKFIHLYSIVKALRPGVSISGSEIWRNAARNSAYPLPELVECTVGDGRQKTKTIRFQDLSKALFVAFPDHEELKLIVDEPEILEALIEVIYLKHHPSNNITEEEARNAVNKLVSDFKEKQQKEDALVAALELPELALSSNVKTKKLCIRVAISHVDGLTPLGSIHDFLSWLQVDKDEKHHDWEHWLHEALEKDKEIIDQALPILGDSDRSSVATKIIMIEYHKFKGIQTPMGNVDAFRRIVRLCVKKSKLADDIVDDALRLWTEKLAKDCPGLSPDARDFLRGTKRRSHDDEDSESSEKKRLKVLLDEYKEHHELALTQKHNQDLINVRQQFDYQRDLIVQHYERAALAERQRFSDEAFLVNLQQNQEELLAKQKSQFNEFLQVSFCGWMRQSLDGYFSTNQQGFFQTLKNVIQGAKQRKKSSHNALLYPHNQRASDREMIFSLTLLSVALELMPELTPRVYDQVKNAYGKRAKVLRTFLHSQGARSSTAEKPLLWTNVPNGGQQYVYLTSEKDILVRAWTGTHFGTMVPRARSCVEMARARLDELMASGLPLGEWTSDSCSLLIPDLSSGPADE